VSDKHNELPTSDETDVHNNCRWCSMPHGEAVQCRHDDLRANITSLNARVEALNSAVVWALEYTRFTKRLSGDGAYWWKLRRLAGDALIMPEVKG
jgi:hypothetical protein